MGGVLAAARLAVAVDGARDRRGRRRRRGGRCRFARRGVKVARLADVEGTGVRLGGPTRSRRAARPPTPLSTRISMWIAFFHSLAERKRSERTLVDSGSVQPQKRVDAEGSARKCRRRLPFTCGAARRPRGARGSASAGLRSLAVVVWMPRTACGSASAGVRSWADAGGCGRLVLQTDGWCVVKNPATRPDRGTRGEVHAVRLQRVQVPSGKRRSAR